MQDRDPRAGYEGGSKGQAANKSFERLADPMADPIIGPHLEGQGTRMSGRLMNHVHRFT